MYHTSVDTERKYVKMKQDVYEHLAKTFLDKNKKKKVIKKRSLWLFVLFAAIVCFIALFILRISVVKRGFFSKSIYVLQDRIPAVIDYDFTLLGDTKIKALAFNLNKLDLSGYDSLEFLVRTEATTKIDSAIKIQIENVHLEKDAKYVSGVNHKWKRFSLSLKNFELIKDWDSIKSLTFIIEDWNVSGKKDRVYIDDVRFVE